MPKSVFADDPLDRNLREEARPKKSRQRRKKRGSGGREADPAAAAAAVALATGPLAVDMESLRRSMVMLEVLGPPRALKPYSGPGYKA